MAEQKEPPDSLRPGDFIGQYRIVRKIGEGGMGVVWEGVRDGLSRRVAIKVLRREYASDSEIRHRFKTEGRAGNIVDHPGILRIDDQGEIEDGTVYNVMEFLAGDSLRVRLERQGRLAESDVVRLGQQIALALAASHNKGIFHRDLKPENVIIVPDAQMPGGERAKIVDFGIAHVPADEAIQSDQHHTRFETRPGYFSMGTVQYMAPEQCLCKVSDGKADVYALGIMFFEMLSGHAPFVDKIDFVVMLQHQNQTPPLLHSLSLSVSERMSALVRNMLAKEAAGRPSMLEVAECLKHLESPAVSRPGAPVTGRELALAQRVGAAYNARWYVARSREEREARSRLATPGAPMVIQGPKWFGKTWLLQHVLSALRTNSKYRLVEVNPASLNVVGPNSALQLRRALAMLIKAATDTPLEWVDEHMSSSAEASIAFEKYLKRILAATPGELLLLAIDGADEIPAGGVRSGFYKQLRALADQGGRDPWSRLRLLLCISTTPAELQPDSNSSPFNLAPPILLGELTPAQTTELLGCYGLSWTDAQRDAVLALVGGHPYLLRALMDVAHGGTPIDELLDGDLDVFEQHLYELDQVLNQNPELRQELRGLLAAPAKSMGQSVYYRLHRLGLVDRVKGTQSVRLRCKLYHRLLS